MERPVGCCDISKSVEAFHALLRSAPLFSDRCGDRSCGRSRDRCCRRGGWPMSCTCCTSPARCSSNRTGGRWACSCGCGPRGGSFHSDVWGKGRDGRLGARGTPKAPATSPFKRSDPEGGLVPLRAYICKTSLQKSLRADHGWLTFVIRGNPWLRASSGPKEGLPPGVVEARLTDTALSTLHALTAT